MVRLTIWEYRSSSPETRMVPFQFAMSASKAPYYRVLVVGEFDQVLIDVKSN